MTENSASDVRVASAAWNDLESLIDHEFVSDWLQVEPARVLRFEEASYVDANPNSVNEGLYPEGLIEGFHLLSLLDYLVNGVSFVDDPRWSGWNYGLDRVRFVSVVTTSDRIRVRGAVVSITPRGENFLVVYRCAIEVEGREKPGVVAEWRVLWTVLDDADAAS
jgi:acyl dehydratase